MSWDIYGEPLRRGHCEVHPHVHEEYPCSVCIADKRSSDQQAMCRGCYEREHLLGLAREHIEHLEQERDEAARDLAMEQEHHQATRRSEEALAAHVEFCHKVLSTIENGPDYLVAKQYRALRLARERKPETSLARLITEERELYEALEELVKQCGHPNISGWVNIERSIAALTKARGES